MLGTSSRIILWFLFPELHNSWYTEKKETPSWPQCFISLKRQQLRINHDLSLTSAALKYGDFCSMTCDDVTCKASVRVTLTSLRTVTEICGNYLDPSNSHFETSLRTAWVIQRIVFACKETTILALEIAVTFVVIWFFVTTLIYVCIFFCVKCVWPMSSLLCCGACSYVIHTMNCVTN